MQARFVVVTIAMLAVLAGCAMPHPRTATPQNCQNRPNCDVVVDPDTGTVPDRVLVTRGSGTTIRWMIPRESRWKWGEKGVEFKAPGNAHFNCPGGQSGPVRTCTKAASAPGGEFEYLLHLVYDPFVVNQ